MTIAPPSYVGAGIILMRLGPTSDENEYLLLKGAETGIWSFSKGHPEVCDGCSSLRTAVRETKEETGLDAGVDYDIIGNSIRFGKRPYWIGLVRTDAAPVTLSPREHSAFSWKTWTEIDELQGNGDVRAWVKKSQRGDFVRLLDAISLLRRPVAVT